jgi:hypothetical protein
MSFYDTQTYCGIVDMKVVVVGICNKINFTKVWIIPTECNVTLSLPGFDIQKIQQHRLKLKKLIIAHQILDSNYSEFS